MNFTTKDSAVKEMPDEFDIGGLTEKLIFIAHVEEGLRQVDEGKKIPLEELKKIRKEWRK